MIPNSNSNFENVQECQRPVIKVWKHNCLISDIVRIIDIVAFDVASRRYI
jgi:hypothetical protein